MAENQYLVYNWGEITLLIGVIWVFSKIWEKKQIIHFNRVFQCFSLFSPSILGFFSPYSWKHPYDVVVFLGGCVVCEIFLDHVTICIYIYICVHVYDGIMMENIGIGFNSIYRCMCTYIYIQLFVCIYIFMFTCIYLAMNICC